MESGKMREYGVVALKAAAALAVLAFLYFYGSLIAGILSENLAGGKLSIQAIVPAFIDVLTLIVGTEIFLIITRYIIAKYLENRGKKKEIRIILTLYTYLVWGFMAMFLASTIFKDIGALLTSIGLIGFGITFALQKPILNFVSWLTIVITKPFNIGDRIEVSGIRGDVLTIQTMYTKIQGTRVNTHEKSEKIITVPNEQILTNPVINYSRAGEIYSDDLTFSVTYESNWRKAVEILEKVTEGVIKKFVKNQMPASFAEKRAWQEAINLLQAASKKLRKGFVRESVKEKIEILKTAESVSEIELPKPKIRLILGASSIDLNVLYQTDLHSVSSSRNEIVRGFLEEVEKRSDIELAYPHMQLVYDENAKKFSAKQKKLFKNPEGGAE